MESCDSSSEINRIVGERIRTLRVELGLTLEDLAERAGIDPVTLSALEAGQARLTWRFICGLSGALGIRMVDLLASSVDASSPVNHRAGQAGWRDPETGILRRRLTPERVGAIVELLEIEYPPGAACDYRNTPFDGIEHQVVVLEGALDLAIDQDANLTTYALEPGDCVFVPRGCGMLVTNPYARSARFIVAISSS